MALPTVFVPKICYNTPTVAPCRSTVQAMADLRKRPIIAANAIGKMVGAQSSSFDEPRVVLTAVQGHAILRIHQKCEHKEIECE